MVCFKRVCKITAQGLMERILKSYKKVVAKELRSQSWLHCFGSFAGLEVYSCSHHFPQELFCLFQWAQNLVLLMFALWHVFWVCEVFSCGWVGTSESKSFIMENLHFRWCFHIILWGELKSVILSAEMTRTLRTNSSWTAQYWVNHVWTSL